MERIKFLYIFKSGKKYILFESIEYKNIGFSPEENKANMFLNAGAKNIIKKSTKLEKLLKEEKNYNNKKIIAKKIIEENLNGFLLLNQNIQKNFDFSEYNEEIVFTKLFNNKKELINYIEEYITCTKPYDGINYCPPSDYTYIINNGPEIKFKKFLFPEKNISYLSFGKINEIYNYENILKNRFKEKVFPYLKEIYNYIENLPYKIKEKIKKLEELKKRLKIIKNYLKIINKIINNNIENLKKEDIEMGIYILNSYSLQYKYFELKKLQEEKKILEKNTNINDVKEKIQELNEKIIKLKDEFEKEIKELMIKNKETIEYEYKIINDDIKFLDKDIKKLNKIFNEVKAIGQTPNEIFENLLNKENNTKLKKYISDYIEYYMEDVINYFVISKTNVFIILENNEKTKEEEKKLLKIAKDKELINEITLFLDNLSKEIKFFLEPEKDKFVLNTYKKLIEKLNIEKIVKNTIKKNIKLINNLYTIKNLDYTLIHEPKEFKLLKEAKQKKQKRIKF